MFTRADQRDLNATDARSQAPIRNGTARTEAVASISPADSRDERVSLSRTSRHSRRTSTPKPILRGPGRSLPDVGTANVTVHAHETIEEEPSQQTLSERDIITPATQSVLPEGSHSSAIADELSSDTSNLAATSSNGNQAEADPSYEPDPYDEDFMDEDDDAEVELTQLTENVRVIDLGQKIEPFVIAHDRDAVIRMNAWNIAWGVQYEIARGVSQKLWTWDDVTDERLEMLQGSSLDMGPLVTDVFGNGGGTLEAFMQAEKIL